MPATGACRSEERMSKGAQAGSAHQSHQGSGQSGPMPSGASPGARPVAARPVPPGERHAHALADIPLHLADGGEHVLRECPHRMIASPAAESTISASTEAAPCWAPMRSNGLFQVAPPS